MSNVPIGPAEAKRHLYQSLMKPGVKSVASYVAHDIANLRLAYPSDRDFADALMAIAKEVSNALAAPLNYGTALDRKTDLRLVFRPGVPTGIEVLAFGSREFPDTVYYTARTRA